MVDKIKKYIEENQKIAIFNHTDIDGDSLSCSYGLLLAIKKAYPQKEIVWVANEANLKQTFPFIEYAKNIIVKDIDDSYLAIIGDTCAQNKIEYYQKLIKAKTIICFDHHQNQIDIKHDLYWREASMRASAVQAIMIAQKLLGDNFDEQIAFHLMIGLLTDTGWFKYSFAETQPVEKYLFLLKYISNKKMDYFFKQMAKRTIDDVKLQQYFYANLKFNGQVVYVYFSHGIIQKMKLSGNFKNKIHSIGNIANYPIWCVFIEEKHDDKIVLKLHMRSNGPRVSEVAIKYGGGGHLRAAGARVDIDKISLKEILKDLNNLSNN